MKESGIVIQTTTNDREIAAKLVKLLLDLRKAACVQVSEIESHYHWDGKLTSHKEFIIIVKSVRSLSPDIFNIIKQNHNYTIPEIIQTNMDECTTEYLAWMIKETKQPVAH